jgi:hypothetical protein
MRSPDDPELHRLAARIADLLSTASRDSVETLREVGAALDSAAAELRARDYHVWLRDVAHVSAGSAANYRRLRRFSAESPSLFLSWKDIGPSKIYMVARLPAGRRAAALQGRLEGRSVREMTDAEFAAVVDRLRDPASRRKVTPRMRAHGLRMRLRAMRADLAAASALGPLPPDAAATLAADLASLSRACLRLRRRLVRPSRAR